MSDRLAALTGWFSDYHVFVSELAKRTKTIGKMPLALWLSPELPHSRKWNTITMQEILWHFTSELSYRTCTTTFFQEAAFYGYAENVEQEAMPYWPRNDDGSPVVLFHGQTRMKNVDWTRWVIFQQPFWMGTSTPGRGSQARQMRWRRWNN